MACPHRRGWTSSNSLRFLVGESGRKKIFEAGHLSSLAFRWQINSWSPIFFHQFTGPQTQIGSYHWVPYFSSWQRAGGKMALHIHGSQFCACSCLWVCIKFVYIVIHLSCKQTPSTHIHSGEGHCQSCIYTDCFIQIGNVGGSETSQSPWKPTGAIKEIRWEEHWSIHFVTKSFIHSRIQGSNNC